MDFEPLLTPLSINSKPCIRFGTLREIYVSEGTYKGTVEFESYTEGEDNYFLEATFFFNCQHLIYNRNIPDLTATDTAFSAFCLNDKVTVYITAYTVVIIGRYNDEDYLGVIRPFCWPIIQSALAFAVGVVLTSNNNLSWARPFINENEGYNRTFDLISPFTDAFGEERALGTQMLVTATNNQHVRLITKHTVIDEDTQLPEDFYTAHTINEMLMDEVNGIFFCPSTTENSRYILNRKVTLNMGENRLILDDVSIVSGIVNTIIVLTLIPDFTDPENKKIYLVAGSKVLDRIQTIYDTELEIYTVEVSVGWFILGRIDHLFCMRKLIEAGGEQYIASLPEYTTGQMDSFILDREIFCVQNVGFAISSELQGMFMIFYSGGGGGYTNLAHNYEVLISYDPDNTPMVSAEVTTLSPFYWEPTVSGGGVTGSHLKHYFAYYPHNASIDPYNMTMAAMTMNGPDYPAIIGGDHIMTGGLYGSMSDYHVAFIEHRTAFYDETNNMASSYTSEEEYIATVAGETHVVYKHDGVEIARGTSTFNFDWKSNIYFDISSTDEATARYHTNNTLQLDSEYSFSEVHFIVARPDLEFYVFIEVQVFNNFDLYNEWPSKPIVANMYAWYRGERTLLSTKEHEIPLPTTINEFSKFYSVIDEANPIYEYSGDEFTVHIPFGPQTDEQGNTFIAGHNWPGYKGSYNISNSFIRFPPFYWYSEQWYADNIDYNGNTHSNASRPDRQRNALYATTCKFCFSPDYNGSWQALTDLYSSTQVDKTYVNNWSWLAESNEINQNNYGLGSTSFSYPRPFTPARLFYKFGTHLGDPMFFGEHLYVSIPDVFTAGLVHEYFSGPDDMLEKIKAAVYSDNPDAITLTSTVA